MPDRIDARPAVPLLGGALLLISLFVTWFTIPATPPATGSVDGRTAWDVFESLDLALAAIGIAAVYSAWEAHGPVPLRRGLAAGGGLGGARDRRLTGPRSTARRRDRCGSLHRAWLALGAACALVVAGVLSVASVYLAVELASRSSETTARRWTAQNA